MAIIESIQGEFFRYKALAEGAIAQLDENQLAYQPGPGGNSIATICWHVSGNLKSRFTDFLTSDGEKPWRRRDEEFLPRPVTRAELLATWEQGWAVLLATLSGLNDAQLGDTITIRTMALRVDEALHRSLAHAAYHVGQIVLVAKTLRGDEWHSLSIPPGQSDAAMRNPEMQRPGAHARLLREQDSDAQH
jgi:uncharacterized damage-inducible protein DinB